MKLPHLVILGAPGSGKGTQAKELSRIFGYQHLSTGDLLRDEMAKKSELGLKVSEIIKSGSLVEDDIVIELLKSNSNLEENSYIFDGFPRNFLQCKMLNDKLIMDKPYYSLYFKIPYHLLVKRIVNRRICSDCGLIYNLISNPPQVHGFCDVCKSSTLVHREDDKEEVLKKRFSIFEESIKDVLEYYRSKGKLVEIDASASQDVILEQIKKLLS